MTGAPSGGPTTGGDGGGGESNTPTKKEYSNGPEPLAIVQLTPKPNQDAPFQPSPHESVAVRVQTVLIGAVAVPEKGLPPESIMPLVHESVQPTSPGYMPPDTEMADVVGAPAGGATYGGDGVGDGGGGSNAPAKKLNSKGPEPLGIVYVMPRPVHVAPFQPSPHESVAVIVQNTLSGTVIEPENGLPPERDDPSLHESTQPTSPGYMPPDTVMADVVAGGGGAVTTNVYGPSWEPAASEYDWPKPVQV